MSEHPNPYVRHQAELLSSLTDTLNQGLACAEELLVGWNLGVRASVLLVKEDPVQGQLAFGKLGGKWCLMYMTIDTTMSIFEASRRVRALAAGRIEALASRLVEELDLQVADMTAANARLREACEAIAATPKP